MIQTKLLHKTIYQANVAVTLPWIEALQSFHPEGQFVLTENPKITKRTAIVGMFVLRPAFSSWTNPILNRDKKPKSLYDQNLDWCYNVECLPGGGTVSNQSAVDAYRLAMQYALSDAVIVGSNTVSLEGVGPNGYIWQHYALCGWNQLKNEAGLSERLHQQRSEWQKQGFLSSRKYPAQIVFTWSGEHYPGSSDFLEARIFHEAHLTGEPIEVFIMTSQRGAEIIITRVEKRYPTLKARLSKMLIVIPPPVEETVFEKMTTSSSQIDISSVPQILHDKLGMLIVNHDGGHRVLKEFSKAGALCQTNLTLCRQQSLREVITNMPLPESVPEDTRQKCLETFDCQVKYFFRSLIIPNGNGAKRVTEEGPVFHRGVPAAMDVVQVLQDEADDVGVVIFDTRKGVEFHD